MVSYKRCVALTAMYAIFTAAAIAQPPLHVDPEARQLREKVVKAYRDIQTYQATILYKSTRAQGRWTFTESTEFFVAIERRTGRMLIDKPQMRLVSDEKKLRLKLDLVPNRHLEVDVPNPLSYQRLIDEMPFISEPILADVVMLLSGDPMNTMVGGGITNLRLITDDPAGLEIKGWRGTMILRIDPQSYLITQAEFQYAPALLGSEPAVSRKEEFQFQVCHNQLLPDDTFALDVAGSEAVGSVQAMVQVAPSFGGGMPTPPPMVQAGQPAPPIMLNTLEGESFKLADVEQDIVILEFWASWCGPCLIGLPKLEAFHQWTRNENKPVAVYTVNLQEPHDMVASVWRKRDFTMPVLMDSHGDTANAYGVQGIPHTVVINRGKVVDVHVGFSPDLESKLKDQVTQLIKQNGRSDS